MLILLILLCCLGCKQVEEVGGQLPKAKVEATPSVEEGYFIGAGGIRLFYRKVGQGTETAVYLHGGPWNMSDGGYELDELAENRTLIAFDQRSGGHSDLVNDPSMLTPEYYVQDLEALCQHFGLEKMILIGQSWGCGLATLYADKHPDKVNRMVLLSPLPPAFDPFWSQRLEKMDAIIGAAGVARINEIWQEIGSVPDSKVADLCNEEIQLRYRGYLTDMSALKRMKVGYCEGSPAAIRHQYKAQMSTSLGNWDFRPILSKLKMPVLVVEGADTHVPLDATREWVKACSDAQLLLVAGANHMTWLEGDIPKLFQSLEEFLSGEWPEDAEAVH